MFNPNGIPEEYLHFNFGLFESQSPEDESIGYPWSDWIYNHWKPKFTIGKVKAKYADNDSEDKEPISVSVRTSLQVFDDEGIAELKRYDKKSNLVVATCASCSIVNGERIYGKYKPLYKLPLVMFQCAAANVTATHLEKIRDLEKEKGILQLVWTADPENREEADRLLDQYNAEIEDQCSKELFRRKVSYEIYERVLILARGY